MAFERWDVVKVPGYLLGLDDDAPTQFGVVVSSKTALEGANRYWIIQIPNPGPQTLVQGDMEVSALRGYLPPDPAIIRTSSIIAIHRDDLEEGSDRAIVRLRTDVARKVMDHLKTFLPRGV